MLSSAIENFMWLTFCVFFEARGEPIDGQVAVAHVVLNRVEKHKISIKEVVQKPKQFSWMNADQRPPIKHNELQYVARCIKSVMICYSERANGYFLDGADHYFNPHEVRPSWSKNMKFIATKGNHEFYRE